MVYASLSKQTRSRQLQDHCRLLSPQLLHQVQQACARCIVTKFRRTRIHSPAFNIEHQSHQPIPLRVLNPPAAPTTQKSVQAPSTAQAVVQRSLPAAPSLRAARVGPPSTHLSRVGHSLQASASITRCKACHARCLDPHLHASARSGHDF